VRLEVDAAAGLFHADGRSLACSIGRSGVLPATDKREGDGATPLGTWPIRAVLLRPDRVAPPEGLKIPWRWIRPDDGWSDGASDPAYNRPVRHPHAYSGERLWRDDGLYDAIVILGHNDSPVMPGAGSAIFLHCWRDGAPTEGCVALPKEELLALLPQLSPGDALTIR
jgi:L,D-peptidoglycan transpeptidase YkuD (ErfK/YbiS/YcfS/YnhG family)